MSFMEWVAICVLALIGNFALAMLIGKFLKSRTN